MIRRFGMLLLVMVLVCFSAAAQSEPASTDFSGLEAVIAEQLGAQNTAGLAIAIVQDGQVIYRNGFGVRSDEAQEPVTPDTLFRIGSTTKPLTALGVLMLAQDGKLDLDAPVSSYVPEFTVSDDITVRHLLSHTAGLNDEANPYGSLDLDALAESMAQFTEASVVAPAGTVHSYSNPGFDIAGRVIEAVSGQYYADYMAEAVFPALNMQRTTLYTNIAITYPVAVGYEPGFLGGRVVTRPNTDNVAEYPSGFAYSSVNDLANLIQFILDEGQPVLNTDFGAQMFTPAATALTGDFRYGLGVFFDDYRGTPMLGHGGKINGYTALLDTLPEHNFGVVVLANNIAFDAAPIFDAAVEAVLDLPAVETEAEVIAPSTLDAYVGAYTLSDLAGETVLDLIVEVGEDSGLIARPTGQPTLDLRPTSAPNTFAVYFGESAVDVEVVFIPDSDGVMQYIAIGYRVLARQTE